MKYNFKFKLFGKNVQMFKEQQMGIVVEKEADVVCVYATDCQHQKIFCAIPLCHPKFLKGMEYIIEFNENKAKVSVGDLQIVIDFNMQKCSNNKGIQCYGSENWGYNVQMEWNEFE